MRCKSMVAVAAFFPAVLWLAPMAMGAPFCRQKDFEGVWNVYAMGSGEWGPWWQACKMVVGRDGKIKDGECTDSMGDKSPIVGGAVNLSRNCLLSGEFKFKDVEEGIVFTATINHGTLEHAKQMAAGVGKNDNAQIFNFTAIRQPKNK